MSAAFEIHGGSNDSISGNIFDLETGSTSFGLLQIDQFDELPQGSSSQLQNDNVTGNIFVTESCVPANPAFANLTNGVGGVSISLNDYWAYSEVAINVSGVGAAGDSFPILQTSAAHSATALASYATFWGAGINFQPINTAQIGLAPTGPTAY